MQGNETSLSFNNDYSIVEAMVIQRLLNECKELNLWLPIEKAPKDKWVLCWIEDLSAKYILRFDTAHNAWVDQGLKKFMTPDLYQYLPDDPKE